MPTEAGLKDLTWATLDGGALDTPTETVSASSTSTGTQKDLLDGTSSLLPDSVAVVLSAQSAPATPTTTLSAEVFVIWQTATGTGKDPTVFDNESQLIAPLTGTTTTTAVQRSNVREVSVKGRFMKLRYKVKSGENVKFASRVAPMFSKVYSA